ncbi:MAG: enoyl-CoA hydratase-related protein [Pseudolabrys sp.]|nr:enoyl-CoA hydratase-related protein [Pseudolabrys sp.]
MRSGRGRGRHQVPGDGNVARPGRWTVLGPEAALTGRFFTAEEAFKANLINRVAAKGKYLDAARELAREVIKNPPLSVRSTVRMRRWYMDRLSREVMFMTAPERLYLTEDFQEAARAFTEKRKPKAFKGR